MRSVSQRLTAFFFCTAFALSAAAVHAQDPQTNVDQAKHMVDDQGVPQLSINGVGKVAHPAWTALYALAYAGIEDYDPSLGLKADPEHFAASVNWLKTNLAQDKNGLWVWPYNFDSTYNDVAIKAPWSSAFAQASGVQALIAHWKKTGDKNSLELAKKAAESLFVPLSEGGFLFTSGQDIWFEEIPAPATNPSHILNGHMRALLALGELKDATDDARYQEWFTKGSDTLLRWLPLYDAGYWLRYDLNPRKDELLFRLANPYGFANPDVAIDRIVLRDPVSGKESVLDVGGAQDAEGALRIAGNDWGQIEQVDGHSVRRLRPITGEREAEGSSGQMVAPHSYFYLALPSEWADNLRNDRFELSVEYLDEQPGNLDVQMRSIAPDSTTFRTIPDGALLLSGDGKWRKWRVPVTPANLGYWVGETYGLKHAEYLSKIAGRDARFLPWKDISLAYVNTVTGHDFVVTESVLKKTPDQTPILPWYSMDKDGVLLMHVFDPGSSDENGSPVYSPFIVATQAIDGPKMPGLDANFKKFNIDKTKVRKAPALEWLLDSRNQFDAAGAIVYKFDFLNIYNDVVTPAPWQSSFGQTYVMKALLHSIKRDETDVARLEKILAQALKAYSVDVGRGGLAHTDRYGGVFFEEVPNRTHVLNAQLSAIPIIDEVSTRLDTAEGRDLISKGVQSLLSNLNKFDTGYWLRYDLNPKKEIMFQLDWLKGDASPLIESIHLQAPQFEKQVDLHVGSEKAFDGASRISGLEWLLPQTVDGRQVRAFNNGYLLHQDAVTGGTRHNAYALMQLPEAKFSDYLDVQPHRLVVRFKDVAAGQFVVKAQSINEGNMLDFVPLRNAVITTTGDQQWKEAVIEVRSQDMGWYKGADYQVFEVGQLEQIAKLTGDWFFEQYAERQRYFLDAKAKGKPVIVEPSFKTPYVPVKLDVLDSSPTYDGFGFENALDGDPNNNYVAGIEGASLEYVSLKLDRPLGTGVFKLRWENRANYARKLRVFATNVDGANSSEISSHSMQSGEDAEISLKASKPTQYLRLEFSDFVGQPRLLLRSLNIAVPVQADITAETAEQTDLDESIGKESNIEVKAEVDHEGGDFLAANAPTNPLRIFHLPVTHAIKKLSDSLVGDASSDHEKVLNFMAHFRDFQVGIPRDSSPDGIQKEKVAACGNFTVLLLALASAQGMEGHVINLYNYPEGMGHTVAEIYVDGKWRLYDPTFEGFYHASSDPKNALSFSEVVEGYSQGVDIIGVFNNKRFGVDEFTGRKIYLNAMPKGVIGPSRPMVFPLSLDIKSAPKISSENFGTKYQGAAYVGIADVNQNQKWKLTGLQAGREYVFTINPKSVGGDIKDTDSGFKLSAYLDGLPQQHQFSIREPRVWRIRFVAKSSYQEIELRHDYSGDKYFYLSFSGFEISEE